MPTYTAYVPEGNPCFTTTEWLDALESGDIYEVEDSVIFDEGVI